MTIPSFHYFNGHILGQSLTKICEFISCYLLAVVFFAQFFPSWMVSNLSYLFFYDFFAAISFSWNISINFFLKRKCTIYYIALIAILFHIRSSLIVIFNRSYFRSIFRNFSSSKSFFMSEEGNSYLLSNLQPAYFSILLCSSMCIYSQFYCSRVD